MSLCCCAAALPAYWRARVLYRAARTLTPSAPSKPGAPCALHVVQPNLVPGSDQGSNDLSLASIDFKHVQFCSHPNGSLQVLGRGAYGEVRTCPLSRIAGCLHC